MKKVISLIIISLLALILMTCNAHRGSHHSGLNRGGHQRKRLGLRSHQHQDRRRSQLEVNQAVFSPARKKKKNTQHARALQMCQGPERFRRKICKRKNLRAKKRYHRGNFVDDYAFPSRFDDIPNDSHEEDTIKNEHLIIDPTRFTPFDDEIGSYFQGIADRFSKRLERYRVQYPNEKDDDGDNDTEKVCPKLPDKPSTCAHSYAKNECWSVGEPDSDCENNALCCYNGCENVCFHGINNPSQSSSSYSSSTEQSVPSFTDYSSSSSSSLYGGNNEVIQNSSNICPPVSRTYRSHRRRDGGNQYCQSSRPNCWSSGTYDLDCPNSGLCCQNECGVNRCLDETKDDAIKEEKDEKNKGQEGLQHLANPRPSVTYYPTILPAAVVPTYPITTEPTPVNPTTIATTTTPKASIRYPTHSPYQQEQEPILVLHIYTPEQNVAKVQPSDSFYYDSYDEDVDYINYRTEEEEVPIDNVQDPLKCPLVGVKPRDECLYAQSQCRQANSFDPNCNNGEGLCCFDGCTYSCMASVNVGNGLTNNAGYQSKEILHNSEIGSQPDEFIPAVEEEKGENAAAALIARRRDIGICSRRDYIVSRSQCRLQLRHECASSSDCSFGFRCCFNGCVNACVRWSFLDLAPSDDPFFYRKKKK